MTLSRSVHQWLVQTMNPRRDNRSFLRFVVAHVHWFGCLCGKFPRLILNLIDAAFDVRQLLSTNVAREQLGLLGQLGQT